MAFYSGAIAITAPSTTDDNWALTAGASKSGKIYEVTWGGESTTSTAMRTRVARSSGQTGAATAITTAQLHPNSPAKGFGLASTFATTQPSLDGGDLLHLSWNSHGGVVRFLAAPGEEFVLIGAATELCISCRNAVGSGTSTYGLIWAED